MSIKSTVIEAIQDYEDGYRDMCYNLMDEGWTGDVTTYNDHITLNLYDDDYTVNVAYSAHIDKWAHWMINDNLDNVINSAIYYNAIEIESEG